MTPFSVKGLVFYPSLVEFGGKVRVNVFLEDYLVAFVFGHEGQLHALTLFLLFNEVKTHLLDAHQSRSQLFN